MNHRKIIHVDMDAFYAAVEQRDNPSFQGRPVVVGGDPRERSVVAAASYEARRFGVHSAMPMKTALRLCPQAVRVPPDFDKYRRVSGQLHEIFREYTDLVEPVAFDEAYLDVTYNKQHIPFGHRAARMLKGQIRRQLQLTASAGVAPNKFLAKIASDLQKPDGLVVVMPDQVQEFLRPLPVEKIPGVGQVTRQHLLEWGVGTIGELAALPLVDLVRRFGKRGAYLWELAQGRDDSPVDPAWEPQQLSQETTFAADVYEREEMRAALKELAEELGGRLRRRQLRGRSVTLKVRYPDFQTITRSQTQHGYLDQGEAILERAMELLERTEAEARGVRLLGVGVSGFEEEKMVQLDLFAGESDPL
jgi:DNA polymerase-4